MTVKIRPGKRSNWLDEIGAEKDEELRKSFEEFAELGYNNVSAEIDSVEAAALYFAAQTNSQYTHITQEKVSEITGVSAGTVSRVFNQMVYHSTYESSRIR